MTLKVDEAEIYRQLVTVALARVLTLERVLHRSGHLAEILPAEDLEEGYSAAKEMLARVERAIRQLADGPGSEPGR